MLITKAEFARQMHVTPAAVGRAVKCGRLTLADGKRLDEAVARIQWDANRQRNPRVKTLPPSASHTLPAAAPTVGSLLPSIEESRRKREHHEATLAELRAGQKAGELVVLADVHLAYTTLAAQLRAALERIPDKLAPRLAAEADGHTVHVLLLAELDAALMDMAQTAAQLPAKLQEAARHE